MMDVVGNGAWNGHGNKAERTDVFMEKKKENFPLIVIG